MTKSAEAELKNSATPGMILPGSSQNTRSAGGHSQSASVKLEDIRPCVRPCAARMANERARARRKYYANANLPVSKEVHAQGKVGGTVITGPGRRIAPHYRPGSEAVTDRTRREPTAALRESQRASGRSSH